MDSSLDEKRTKGESNWISSSVPLLPKILGWLQGEKDVEDEAQGLPCRDRTSLPSPPFLYC